MDDKDIKKTIKELFANLPDDVAVENLPETSIDHKKILKRLFLISLLRWERGVDTEEWVPIVDDAEFLAKILEEKLSTIENWEERVKMEEKIAKIREYGSYYKRYYESLFQKK